MSAGSAPRGYFSRLADDDRRREQGGAHAGERPVDRKQPVQLGDRVGVIVHVQVCTHLSPRLVAAHRS